MITLANPNGAFTHIVKFPETPEDDEEIARLEEYLPLVDPGKIETMRVGQTYRLPRASMTHESEESGLHLYRR